MSRHKTGVRGQPVEGEHDGYRLRQTLPQAGSKTAHFCSIKITEDVRKYAAEQGVAEDEALKRGLEQRATEFNEAGAEIYAKT